MWQLFWSMISEYPLIQTLIAIMDHTIMGNPLSILVTVIALAVIIEAALLIRKYRNSQKLLRIAPFIDFIPFIIGLVPLTILSTQVINLIQAFSSIQNSGTGDPRVVSGGMASIFLGLTVLAALFILFLGSWLLVRLFYERTLAKLDR